MKINAIKSFLTVSSRHNLNFNAKNKSKIQIPVDICIPQYGYLADLPNESLQSYTDILNDNPEMVIIEKKIRKINGATIATIQLCSKKSPIYDRIIDKKTSIYEYPEDELPEVMQGKIVNYSKNPRVISQFIDLKMKDTNVMKSRLSR